MITLREREISVFSCFACGGGSTMGYKLAGCNVLGCCEIDPKMNEVYVKNHHPKYNYLMDIRKFNEIPNDDLPGELLNLDILDGSPPCTTFSIAGDREESWGVEKKFREGQVEQTLDDLSFVFIETVKKLNPKVVIMENVEGLLLGEAFSYVQRIYKEFNEAGYFLHHWLLKGENMGVPQTRHRVFFIAIRADLEIDPKYIDMSFNYEPITYGDIKSGVSFELPECITKDLIRNALKSEKTISDVNQRLCNKTSGFQQFILDKEDVLPTMRAKPDLYDREELARISVETMIASQTFPTDYDFGEKRTTSSVGYVCGMSVPPIMIKRIVNRLIEYGVFDYKQRN